MLSYFIEFLGTLVITYVIVATMNPLAMGGIYALVLLVTKQFSTGYFNPAITIALASNGNLQYSDVFMLCLVQMFGALVGLELYKRFGH